jgi:predicted nucleic acid-binding protein
MSKEPNGSMVFDTGILVEIIRGSKPAVELKSRLESGTLTPHTTDLNLFELGYLTCRREGWTKAKSVVESIRESGYFEVHEVQEFLWDAARMKCDRAISIVDCITISLGDALSIPILFARHEKELDDELKKRPFRVELRFLIE